MQRSLFIWQPIKVIGLLSMCFAHSALVADDVKTPTHLQRVERKNNAKALRDAAALQQFQGGIGNQLANGDEAKYANHIGSFSKGLAHDSKGIVDEKSFQSMLSALHSGVSADFDNIILGGARKLIDPQAAFACALEGCDGWRNITPPAPALASAQAAGEMVELYWAALLRDVPFNHYDKSPRASQAIQDINKLSDFNGPRVGGVVTAGTLFRGFTPGDLVGPYVSQFLYLPVPSHETTVSQFKNVPVSGTSNDFLTDVKEFLSVQNGGSTGKHIQFTTSQTFIKDARDLGDYVHLDYAGEAGVTAAMILRSFGPQALDDNNPYKSNATQEGFITYALIDLLELLALASRESMKATWYQKWLVHLRLRPEYFGFLVHQQKTAAASFPVHSDVLNSAAVSKIFSTFGSYLLPQMYPEGSPNHPSYPAGHATFAGACATILKAFFKEDFVIPNPVEPNHNNTALVPSSAVLTIGNELNKLAANVAIARNLAGVHYRSDALQSLLLGEKIAISILNDEGFTKNNTFAGYTLTKFDGTVVTVGAKQTV